MLKLDDDAFRGGAKYYAPKLTDEERLGIIALHRMGVKATVLSLAFGVNRRTVGKLVNNHEFDYADVKKIASKLESDQLYALYVTDEMVDKVNKAAKRVKDNQL